MDGWRVTYLGSDLPSAEIAAAAGARVVSDFAALRSELGSIREAAKA